MKTPETRPRFQTATRHYHRHRSDVRGWDDWIDQPRKRGSRGRAALISAVVTLAMAGVGLLFALDVL